MLLKTQMSVGLLKYLEPLRRVHENKNPAFHIQFEKNHPCHE